MRKRVDVHFSDVRPHFAMDAGTTHTVHLSMSALPYKNECAPDKNAQIVRSPSWSTCFTVSTDICNGEGTINTVLRLRQFASCEGNDMYHFLVSRPVPRGCGGCALPRSC